MSLLRDRMMRDMERAGLAPCTCYRYIRAVRLLAKFHGKSPELITAEGIQAWNDDLIRRGLSPSSRRVYLSAVAFLLERTLAKPELASAIQFPKVPYKLPDVLTPKEVSKLLSCVNVLRYQAFFSLIYDTGLRISEAANLKVGDIDRARGVIHVRHGKGGNDRQVKLGDRLYEILQTYWREERQRILVNESISKETYLFVGINGRRICVVVAGQVIRKAAKVAGITQQVTPHTLRHSFATAQMESGTGLRVVQAQLGHASIRTTQRYLHVSTRLICQAPSPLDALDF